MWAGRREYRDSFRGIQMRGMEQDLTWDKAAQQYEEVRWQRAALPAGHLICQAAAYESHLSLRPESTGSTMTWCLAVATAVLGNGSPSLK